ncbi:MAG: hypothetical protein AAGD25_41220 [Cyanobacteria bacterium P01_F01_bin.150]
MVTMIHQQKSLPEGGSFTGTPEIVSSIPTGVRQVFFEAVTKNLAIAKKQKRKPSWVYYDTQTLYPNLTELRWLASQLGYKPAWADYKEKEIAQFKSQREQKRRNRLFNHPPGQTPMLQPPAPAPVPLIMKAKN